MSVHWFAIPHIIYRCKNQKNKLQTPSPSSLRDWQYWDQTPPPLECYRDIVEIRSTRNSNWFIFLLRSQCVCIWKRERKKERENDKIKRERERERERERVVCVCVQASESVFQLQLRASRRVSIHNDPSTRTRDWIILSFIIRYSFFSFLIFSPEWWAIILFKKWKMK